MEYIPPETLIFDTKTNFPALPIKVEVALFKVQPPNLQVNNVQQVALLNLTYFCKKYFENLVNNKAKVNKTKLA